MSRVYVAAPLPLLISARAVAGILARAGHVIVSTWHTGEPTIAIERTLSREEMGRIGGQCLDEVGDADALMLLYGPETTRSGSVLETGFALGRGLPVVAMPIGADASLPTMLLRARGVRHETTLHLLDALRDLEATP